MGREDGKTDLSVAVANESVRAHRYASAEEVLRAYRETLAQHERAYRELAKGPGAPADDE